MIYLIFTFLHIMRQYQHIASFFFNNLRKKNDHLLYTVGSNLANHNVFWNDLGHIVYTIHKNQTRLTHRLFISLPSGSHNLCVRVGGIQDKTLTNDFLLIPMFLLYDYVEVHVASQITCVCYLAFIFFLVVTYLYNTVNKLMNF